MDAHLPGASRVAHLNARRIFGACEGFDRLALDAALGLGEHAGLPELRIYRRLKDEADAKTLMLKPCRL
jgi:hypothetical protein